MKKGILFVVLVLLSQIALASKTYFYNGYVLTTEGEKIAYEIKFTLKDDNKIIGYSITAKGTENEMKARLIGLYKPSTKYFYLKETRVLTTKKASMTYCYFVVKAKLTKDSRASLLKGTFVGYEEDTKTFCTKGKVFLRGTVKVNKPKTAPIVKAKPKPSAKPKVVAKPKPKVTPKPKVAAKPKPKVVAKPKPKTKPIVKTIKRDTLRSDIAKKKNIAYNWNSDKLNIQFWDDSKLDGDALNFFINGRPVFKNYILKGERKVYELPLKAGTYSLKIQAVNEGDKPPNTARVVLIDGLKNYDLITHIREGQEVVITLQKK